MIFEDIKSFSQNLEFKGRIIGLDVGTKTIGVAICDDTQTISTPKLTISRKSNQKDFLILKNLIEENNIKAIIVGLPFNMDGSESDMSKFVRKFTDNLDQFLQNVKITFFDERLTSFAAEDIISEVKIKNNKNKKLVDQIAASLILQGALDDMKKSNI